MKKNLGFVGWALVGGAVGAAVALLTAPSSGRETRERLGRRIQDGKQGLLRRGRRALDSAAALVPARRAVAG
jgi:gas vesicle protein